MRAKQTACAVPDLSNLHLLTVGMNDINAEHIVLSGMMRSVACVVAIREAGITKSDFYWDSHQRLHDVIVYIANGSQKPLPTACFAHMRRTRDWLGLDRRKAVMLLADVYTADYWMPDMEAIADPCSPLDNHTWAALAASQKVLHHSARRQAVYRALEIIRDAVSPVGGVDEIRNLGG